jgi:hypothetical protein
MQLAQPLQHLFAWPVDALLAAMPGEEDPAWDVFSARQARFAVHNHTRSINFIWSEGWNGEGEPDVLRLDYAPVGLRDAADDIARATANHFGGVVTRLILAELRAGTSIPPHRDSGPLLTLVHRCHLPIITNPAVSFTVDQVDHHLQAGEVYEFDNMRTHSVSNGGTERRVHLICNVLPPANQRRAYPKAASSAAK